MTSLPPIALPSTTSWQSGPFGFFHPSSPTREAPTPTLRTPSSPPTESPAEWLRALFSTYLSDTRGVAVGFAPHHLEIWDWVWALERGVRPEPLVAILGRGGAKSTTAELALPAIAARRARRYALYICETQAQADDHVTNVAAMLESAAFGARHPDVADRLLGRWGHSRGWRRNRLRTASGFTVDALGLDTAARGVKIDEARPDLLIFDDVDDAFDTARGTARKIGVITKTLLPAGSADLAVLAIQNLVQSDGVFAQLADGRAEFLAGRRVIGPVPVLTDFEYARTGDRWTITGGAPTWEGQDLAACEALLNDIGPSAFAAECQHEVDEPEGGLFSDIEYDHCAPEEVPELVRTVVWVDPAVTDTDHSDCQGIQADGLGVDGRIYRLRSWEGRCGPEDALQRALLLALELGGTTVGVETDQGGDTWQPTFEQAWLHLVRSGVVPSGTVRPRFAANKAGAGFGPKAHRANQMHGAYERGRFVHVLGTHRTLERGLARFGLRKPFDLVDAAFWSWLDLTGHDDRKGALRFGNGQGRVTLADQFIRIGGGA